LVLAEPKMMIESKSPLKEEQGEEDEAEDLVA
jgi:hypothetical protein